MLSCSHCLPPSQLTGCTKPAATIYTTTTGTTTFTSSLNTWGLAFHNGKMYAADTGNVVVCDDPVALTGCSRLRGCNGTSTPSTIDKGCDTSASTFKSPLRVAILTP